MAPKTWLSQRGSVLWRRRKEAGATPTDINCVISTKIMKMIRDKKFILLNSDPKFTATIYTTSGMIFLFQ
uniref:Uncharacterized protein n=1 Tax=Romanomermis culicivorax TaxID=13658 RepID=A0A915KKR6_ROMCU